MRFSVIFSHQTCQDPCQGYSVEPNDAHELQNAFAIVRRGRMSVKTCKSNFHSQNHCLYSSVDRRRAFWVFLPFPRVTTLMVNRAAHSVTIKSPQFHISGSTARKSVYFVSMSKFVSILRVSVQIRALFAFLQARRTYFMKYNSKRRTCEQTKEQKC